MPTTKEAFERLINPTAGRAHKKDEPVVIHAGTETQPQRNISFVQFEELMDKAVAWLEQSKVGKQSMVILCSENSAELGAAILATWRLGAIAVPVDCRITPPELANVAKRLSAKVILASAKVLPDQTKLQELVGQEIGVLNLTSLPEQTALSKTAVALEPKQPVLMILTSGTTGLPKGAVHDLDSMVVNLLELGEMAGINDEKRGVLPLPLSHIFGLEVFLVAVVFGMQIVFSDMAPSNFVACLQRIKPHVLVGVPTIYGALMALPQGLLDLSNAEILLSGGAPLPLSLAQEFQTKFGKRINNGYGSTESKIVALNKDGPFEAVGQIAPSVTIDIVNDKDEVLAIGETGEIRITGPILMQGYLSQPEATEKVLHDGHYHTGDMGYFKDGYLYISGRFKEMIIVAGFKVFPAEIEDVLRQHPLVKEIAVFGTPHRQLGQIVKAVVVLKEGDHSNRTEGSAEDKKAARQELLAQFKEFCKEKLRRELRPMDWDFQPASKPLPKTLSGKIDKKQLEVAPV